MLIQFSVRNFKSIKDEAILSFVSGSANKMGNTFAMGRYDILPSAVIYGANASGKSAVIEAFAMMRNIVLNTNRIMLSTDELPTNSFRLSTETINASTAFDVVFEVSGKRYKYGFEYNTESIVYEYLYVYETVRPTCVFLNNGKLRTSERFKEFRKNEKINKNFLFIWKADQDGNYCAKETLKWFKQVSVIGSDRINAFSAPDFQTSLLNENKHQSIVSFLKAADIGIEDFNINTQDISFSNIPESVQLEIAKNVPVVDNIKVKKISIDTIHIQYNKNKKPESFLPFVLGRDESRGTISYFYLLTPILKTLESGALLMIDELDVNLHPLLTQKIVDLFNNPKINKNHAQLLFTTQDINLLRKRNFHKSQIWFTEKDEFGCSHLTSLAEYKNIDSKIDYDKNYLMGKYGAIPYLGQFDFIEKVIHDDKKSKE